MGHKEDPAVANHISGQSNKPISQPPHVLPAEQVVQELKTDGNDGLSPEEAQRRLEEYGRNEFGEQKGVQPLRIIGGQLANAMTLVSFQSPTLLFAAPRGSRCFLSSPAPWAERGDSRGNCRIMCISDGNDVIARPEALG